MAPEELYLKLKAIFDNYETEQYGEALEQEIKPEDLDGYSREEYKDTMEKIFDDYGVPQEMRDDVYEQLDAHGAYDGQALIENLTIVVEDNDITQHVDNSLNIEDGAEVHGGVWQENETNLSNATGDGAVAGRDQDGQFQTGDGVQVGDGNDGVVNQGTNSGQIAGETAHADDITTGDGNFNNEGTIDDSAVAFGEGHATNQADDVWDESTNDSYNDTNSYNTTDSHDTEDSENYTETYESTETAHIEAEVDVVDSFKEDNDWIKDHSKDVKVIEEDDHYGHEEVYES